MARCHSTRFVPRQSLLYHDGHSREIRARLATGEVRLAVDGVEIIRDPAPDPAVWKKESPIAMPLHSASAVMEYKDIKIEAKPKEEKRVTVK